MSPGNVLVGTAASSRDGAPRRGRARRQPPDVVVWQADGEPLPGTGYGGRLAARLARLGCTVEVVDYRERGLTAAQQEAPVHVISGGETSAFSDDAATRRARDVLAEQAQRAWADEATLVGICLGSQLLARVVAPELPRSTPDRGMEAGWQEVEGPQGTTRAAELHYEQIHPELEAVDGVTVTHRNDHSPVQAFRWGRSTIGMQFHPEWSPTDLRSVLRRHRHLLAARHHDPRGAERSVHGLRQRRPADLFDELVVQPVLERLRPAPALAPVAAVA